MIHEGKEKKCWVCLAAPSLAGGMGTGGGEALEAEALDGREGLQVAGMLLCL